MAIEGDAVLTFEERINLTQCLDDLKSDVKTDRKRVLEKILKELDDIRSTDASELVRIFPLIYTCILRCFSDKTEVCRDLSVDIISQFIEYLPLNDYYLTYIIPVIAKRIGMAEIIEGSEELRLKLVILVKNIILKYNTTKYLTAFFNDFTNILVKTATDVYSKVKVETCKTIILLSNAIRIDFHMQCESFVKPVISNFSHQHQRVRVTAVQCIGAVVSNGNHKCFEDSITPMAEKLFDEIPSVRLQVIREVGEWMLHHKDRCSYWHRMIPLLLTGLSDVIEDIRLETAEVWDKVGKKFMIEYEEDLKPQMDFMRQFPEHYPKETNRPNLGCRTLVERNIGKIIPAITRELGGWQIDSKLRSAQLLSWLVLCAEQSILQHSAATVHCLLVGARDTECKVVSEIYRASELLGYFVEPKIWWKLLKTEIGSEPCLGVLANIIKGTKSEILKDVYLKKITRKLACPDICRGRKQKYQLNLLNACESFLHVCAEDCYYVGQELFNIIFTVYSMPSETEIEHKALCLLEELRSTIKCGKHVNDLFYKYISNILGSINNDANMWIQSTPEKCILDTVLIHTGPALGLNLHIISPLLVEALNSKEIDPEVKLRLFTNLSSVLLSKSVTFQLSSSEHMLKFLTIVVEDIIVPNLVWKAGKTEEAIRTAAVCCLCAVLQDDNFFGQETNDFSFEKNASFVTLEFFLTKESLEPYIEKLLPLLIGLVSDNSKVTMLYALRAIYYIAKMGKKKDCLTHDHLHKTYPVVMKCLDDSNQKVRRASVQTLQVLFVSRPLPYDIGTFSAHLEAVYGSMLIHLDDSDEAFQSLILGALIELSRIHPELLKKKVGAKMNVFRNKVALKTLEKYLESLSI